MLLTQSQKYFLIAFLVVVADQSSKMLVVNNMELHEEINVLGDWFRIHYLLNPGMAFGIKWNSEFGKLALTLFRIAAMIGIAVYLHRLAKRNAHPGLLLCIALILGGAVGNVIDSTFYGVLLNNAPPDSPTPWFHGQVIDMLFFPLFDFVWPEWVPFVGGDYFLFFSPVFNLADSFIFIGVMIIFIMQKKFFKNQDEQPGDNPPAVTASAEETSEQLPH
ncbi:MAG: lipoprotein signal peptidase [Cyclobacteriaceae bacterium]|nr:lipoprotein signal peptidase [Cyclobacteriaceae bacterium]MDW8331652.1 lipoprotein signal peptidase [Cyclobacteriaceae bacterium]